jgi:outer membrane protein TolC
VTIRSQTREAHAAYRGSWEIARHMENTILPLRREIQQESLLHYNGMLKDLSSFIADTRMNILARAQFIEAKRNFWIAESEMRAALAGGGSGVSNPGAGPVSAPVADSH